MAQERGELLHCGVPAVSVASARQDSSTAYVRAWTLNPRRGSTAFLSLSISACQSSQLQNTPSSSTFPNEILWKEHRSFQMVIKKGHSNPS